MQIWNGTKYPRLNRGPHFYIVQYFHERISTQSSDRSAHLVSPIYWHITTQYFDISTQPNILTYIYPIVREVSTSSQPNILRYIYPSLNINISSSSNIYKDTERAIAKYMKIIIIHAPLIILEGIFASYISLLLKQCTE